MRISIVGASRSPLFVYELFELEKKSAEQSVSTKVKLSIGDGFSMDGIRG